MSKSDIDVHMHLNLKYWPKGIERLRDMGWELSALKIELPTVGFRYTVVEILPVVSILTKVSRNDTSVEL